MARVLEVKVEELGALGAQSTKNLAISSTCTVFAESEVISSWLRAPTSGTSSTASTTPWPAGWQPCPPGSVRDQVVMTGGVAQNIGVVKALEQELGVQLFYTFGRRSG